ncbi:MAG: putative lipid II flippase FtsW [Desulfuromonadaceae bacterium]|nr:putative lipid II flippase FtsW [Desulfuromonadaceae bacterium]
MADKPTTTQAQVGAKKGKKSREFNATILILTLTLCCFGILMVYSSSSLMALRDYGDSLYFLKRQAIFATLGTVLMLVAMHVNYNVWRKFAIPLLVLSTILLAVVFIPGVGSKAGGAARWISVAGFTFQPSEAAKIALIFYLAHSTTKKEDRIREFGYGYIPYMCVLLVWLGLMLAQRDLGGAAIMAVVTSMMLLIAGTRWLYLILSMSAIIPFGVFMVAAKEYRMQRIMAFLDPWADPLGAGFQIIQSWMGFGLGGLIGAGLGEGEQKRFYLPEAHTDFIFSVIGEELGFLVVVLLICMYLSIVVMGMRIAMQAADGFGRLSAFGISLLLGMQAFANMAVVMGVVPNKGLALPFLSYGGSSLLCTMFSMGVLLNISSHVSGETAK